MEGGERDQGRNVKGDMVVGKSWEHNNVNNKTINELKKKKNDTNEKKRCQFNIRLYGVRYRFIYLAMLPEPQFPNCTMGSISLSVYHSIKQMSLTWLQVGISK